MYTVLCLLKLVAMQTRGLAAPGKALEQKEKTHLKVVNKVNAQCLQVRPLVLWRRTGVVL